MAFDLIPDEAIGVPNGRPRILHIGDVDSTKTKPAKECMFTDLRRPTSSVVQITMRGWARRRLNPFRAICS
jgi:hypothetical protein